MSRVTKYLAECYFIGLHDMLRNSMVPRLSSCSMFDCVCLSKINSVYSKHLTVMNRTFA